MKITDPKFTEQDIMNFAEKAAETVVIREVKDGKTSDTRRTSTDEEKAIVERAIAAALLAIQNAYEMESAKSTAEFFVHYKSGEPHINSFDSVYIPVSEFLEANQ
jgi:hypothetical protein